MTTNQLIETHDEGLPIVMALASLGDTYHESTVLDIVTGIGMALFMQLDESPGLWGHDIDGNEWHWKLRRARNNANGFLARVIAR